MCPLPHLIVHGRAEHVAPLEVLKVLLVHDVDAAPSLARLGQHPLCTEWVAGWNFLGMLWGGD